jgi:HlyD family secretion protein
MPRLKPSLLVLAALLALGACHKGGGGDDANKKMQDALGAESRAQLVTAAVVNTRLFTRTLLVSGEVRPVDDIRVTSPIANVRINKVMVDVGERVKANQVLATLDAPLADAQAQSAEAQVTRAKAAVLDADITWKNAKGDLDRALTIADTGALSVEQIDARRARADGAGAKLDLAKADLQLAQAQLAESKARLQGGAIRAPRPGLVIERGANPGQPAEGGTLFRIAGDGGLEVSAEVPETDLDSLIRGQKAIFTLSDGAAVEAKLRRAPAAIEDQSRAGYALFDLPEDGRIKVGMFLRGEAKLPPRSYPSAPASAIVYDAGRPAVFVIDDQNRVRKRVVTLGPREGGQIALIDGVRTGERIAAGGVAFLLDGDLVRLAGS